MTSTGAARERREQVTEWVVEPCDEFGDITDPQFFGARKADNARGSIVNEFSSDAAVCYVDFAKRVRLFEFDGECLSDDYTYVFRQYRDGELVPCIGYVAHNCPLFATPVGEMNARLHHAEGAVS